jgi:ankyrin repeat protein
MKPLLTALLAAALSATVPVAAQQQALPQLIAPKFNDVMTAVVYGDLGAVNELLALGRWPDKPDSQGRTPLMVARELGHAHIAEALLRAGANPQPAESASFGATARPQK